MEEKNMAQEPEGVQPNEEGNKEEVPERETRSYLVAREPSLDRRCRPRPEGQKCLLSDLNPESSDSFSECALSEESPGTSGDVEKTNVQTGPQVYLRLRPVVGRSTSYSISEDGNVLVTYNRANRVEKQFGFTAIFDSSVDQRQIYDTCVGPKIFEEECVTIMTYGTSGSGKTFTLLGDDQSAGIIPRALNNIFSICKDNIHASPKMKLVNGCIVFLQDDASLMEMHIRKKLLEVCPDIGEGLKKKIEEDHVFTSKTFDSEEAVMIWVSFVEIYNELVYDLLEVPVKPAKVVQDLPRKNLKIVWNKGQVFVQGLTSVYVQSSDEALRLLRLGQQRSTSAETAVNNNSSRSHCVFTVDMIKYHRALGVTTQSSYKFCDLAGSERVNSTGTTGQRLKEAKNINTSLMVLGRCLDAASTAQKKKNVDVIPYRDSKLTMLLQAALLGKEKLAMIVTVSPVDTFYEENLNVLNFASIAKNISFKETVIKQHRSSYAGIMEFSRMAADNKDSEYTKALEERVVELELKLEELQYVIAMQNQLLEQKEKESERKEKDNEQKVQEVRENTELMLSTARRMFATKIQLLNDEVERLRNPRTDMETTQETDESQSVIEIADDDE